MAGINYLTANNFEESHGTKRAEIMEILLAK
jgi:hypothetical protein